MHIGIHVRTHTHTHTHIHTHTHTNTLIRQSFSAISSLLHIQYIIVENYIITQ